MSHRFFFFADTFSITKVTRFAQKLLHALKWEKGEGSARRGGGTRPAEEIPCPALSPFQSVTGSLARPQGGHWKWSQRCVPGALSAHSHHGERREWQGCVRVSTKAAGCNQVARLRWSAEALLGETVSVVSACLSGQGRDVWPAPPILWLGPFPSASQENY